MEINQDNYYEFSTHTKAVYKSYKWKRFKTINPFASIGRTAMSKGKIKVRDICLNISFLT